jgi:enoyl-CoA hydratase/carnithine racemase
MGFSAIEVERVEEAILLITMTREPEMNTLSLEFVDELTQVLRDAGADPIVRALILTGQGRAFCCGADLRYYTTAGEAVGPDPLATRNHYLRRVLKLFTEIETFDKPVIAAINGYALGGGAELALACDFRIMSEGAKFGVPEVRLGAIPGGGGVQKLHRFVGRGRAMEMVMLGSHLTAEEAERYGLLLRRVPPERLRDEALDLARRLVRLSPVALAYAKASINLAMDVDVTSANLYALDAMALLASSEDQREGIRAFFEKREPRFPGFPAGSVHRGDHGAR